MWTRTSPLADDRENILLVFGQPEPAAAGSTARSAGAGGSDPRSASAPGSPVRRASRRRPPGVSSSSRMRNSSIHGLGSGPTSSRTTLAKRRLRTSSSISSSRSSASSSSRSMSALRVTRKSITSTTARSGNRSCRLCRISSARLMNRNPARPPLPRPASAPS